MSPAVKLLMDHKLHLVARMKLTGSSNAEIAERLDCSIRTVQYMVKELEAQLGIRPKYKSVVGGDGIVYSIPVNRWHASRRRVLEAFARLAASSPKAKK